MKIGLTWCATYTINDGQGKLFEVASSKDLLTRVDVATVDLSAVPNLVKAWAPELITDTNGDIYAYFSRMDSNTIGQSYYVKATSAVLSTWGAPVAQNWGGNIPANFIDATFVRQGGLWYFFFKNEARKSIERATSPTLTGTYTTDKTGDWAGWGIEVEGPELVRIGDKWRMYADRYFGDGYAYNESDVFETWTPLVSLTRRGFPAGETVRHGSFIRLTSLADAQTTILATSAPLNQHAEYTASNVIQANTPGGPGTFTLNTAARNQTAFISVPAAGQIRLEAAGYYAINWVGVRRNCGWRRWFYGNEKPGRKRDLRNDRYPIRIGGVVHRIPSKVLPSRNRHTVLRTVQERAYSRQYHHRPQGAIGPSFSPQKVQGAALSMRITKAATVALLP